MSGWGRSERKWLFYWRKTRFALDCWAIYLFEIDDWSISNRWMKPMGAIFMKMAVLLKENASRPVELWLGGTHHAHLSVWNRTLVDFKQIHEHPDAQRRHLSVWYQSLFDFKQIHEHLDAQRRHLSFWNQSLVDFKKDNALTPNVFRYHAQLSLWNRSLVDHWSISRR